MEPHEGVEPSSPDYKTGALAVVLIGRIKLFYFSLFN